MTETFVMLQTAYKDSALSEPRVYDSFSIFENSEITMEYQPRSGCSSKTDEN